MNSNPSKQYQPQSSEKTEKENKVKFNGQRANVGNNTLEGLTGLESSPFGSSSDESLSSSNSKNKSGVSNQKKLKKPCKDCKEYSVNSSNLSENYKFKTKGQAFCDWFAALLARIFSFPYFQGERICFHRDDLEPADPRSLRTAWKGRKEVEDLVNFGSVEIKNMYANILKRRIQVNERKDKYHFAEVNMQSYPGWDPNVINRHRATFQVFDMSSDGVVDYEEFNTVLSEFGDKTPPEIRLKYFSKGNNTDEYGALDFDDFLTVFYELTEKRLTCPADKSLVDTFKKIDNNMAIRCKLDVLGQLEGGLF